MSTAKPLSETQALRIESQELVRQIIDQMKKGDLTPAQKKALREKLDQAIKVAKIRAGEPPDVLENGGVA